MKMTYRARLALSVVICGLLVGSAGNAKEKEVVDQGDTVQPKVKELTPENFHPAFTKNTVIKLNEIVSRSLGVINEYDAIIHEARNSVGQATKSGNVENAVKIDAASQIERLNQLSARSKLVLADMLAAEKELKASDEIYNAAILAGMKDFVSDVEREVSAQSDKLAQSLTKR